MKRLLLGLLFAWPLCLMASIGVSRLRVENMTEPLGIDTSTPRFSWEITADGGEKDVLQTGYEIVVSSDGRELWNSGRVSSDEQLWVPYQGERLRAGQHLTWRVKVYTNRGETPWSREQHFSIGLLTEGQWGGRWIGLEHLQPGEVAGQLHSSLAARYLRQVFTLPRKAVKRATAYISGLGFYRLFVGEQEVGADDMLKPAPTDYRKTILYNTYDVTTHISDTL